MLLESFFKKRRSPLDAVLRRTLLVFLLTNSLLLASFGGRWTSSRRVLGQFRPIFFNLDLNLALLALILALALGELLLVSPKMCITTTTAVTLPIFVFSRAFSSALILTGTGCVTMIGRGYVDCKSDINGLSNLRRLSTTNSMSQHPFPIPNWNHYWTSHKCDAFAS
jgi:hypothetical protein